MATVYCDNCGTSLLEETAKFCRACGKPTPLSEAATKRFDEQPVLNNPTSPVGASFTTPAYMAPFEMPPAQQTNDLRKRQKRNVIILVSMLAVMIFALAGLLAFLSFGVDQRDIAGPPEPPPIVGVPPPPPGVAVPTPPSSPPVFGGPSTIDPSLLYPGASQTMSVNREGGKGVVQLRTNDSVRKVADWYMARLKITKKVEIAGQTILKAGDIGVMIFGGDDGAQILITRGDE